MSVAGLSTKASACVASVGSQFVIESETIPKSILAISSRSARNRLLTVENEGTNSQMKM